MKQISIFKHAPVLALVVFLLFGCAKKEASFTGPNLHVVGHSNNGGYWKNGNPVSVSNMVGATGIFVSGNDIYICGTDADGNGAYWKNGAETSLGQSSPSAITVVGQDVYVSGVMPKSNSYNLAVYWKNGTVVPLTKGLSDAKASSIAVSGSDIFAAGYEDKLSEPNISQIAKYWKNGNKVVLSDSSNKALASSIIISGSDIYVTGSESNYAKYWKNGTPVLLTDGTYKAIATSITLSGSDVYVAGYEYLLSPGGNYPFAPSIAKYWKNGTPVLLTDGTTTAFARSIAVSKSGDVYVVGQVFDAAYPYIQHATIWKNGVATHLDNSTSNSDALSIFLVE
jgi:hypothetical protein